MSTLAPLAPVADDLSLVEGVLAEVAHVEFPPLAALLEHVLLRRGKRLRPALVLLATRFGSCPVERARLLAASIELLHTATLVHDDLIDNADSRRGVTTLHKLVGDRATILVGDYLFARAAELCTASENTRAMAKFGEVVREICDGELYQLLGEATWRPTLDDYYRRISRKTAALFRAAAETGAIVGGAPEEVIGALRGYGLDLGMAFQIVDDVLDFVGDEATLGKPVGGDLRQGIVTLPAMWLIENRPEDHSVERVFASKSDAEEAVVAAVQAVVDSPAIDYAFGVAREFAGRAKARLAALPDRTERQSLLNLADFVVERRS